MSAAALGPAALERLLNEVRFSFARSGGPGGQNVNKTSTRVTLWFDVAASATLTPEQRARIRTALAGRINAEGVLHITSSKFRSQPGNRSAAVERFVELLTAALTPVKPRKATHATAGSKRRRLEAKRLRGLAKRSRQAVE